MTKFLIKSPENFFLAVGNTENEAWAALKSNLVDGRTFDVASELRRGWECVHVTDERLAGIAAKLESEANELLAAITPEFKSGDLVFGPRRTAGEPAIVIDAPFAEYLDANYLDREYLIKYQDGHVSSVEARRLEHKEYRMNKMKLSLAELEKDGSDYTIKDTRESIERIEAAFAFISSVK